MERTVVGDSATTREDRHCSKDRADKDRADDREASRPGTGPRFPDSWLRIQAPGQAIAESRDKRRPIVEDLARHSPKDIRAMNGLASGAAVHLASLLGSDEEA